MTEQTNLIPKRRFKGFQSAHAWELGKLGELANFSKGNGYSKSDLTSVGKPVILYGRLYTKYETIIEYVDTFTLEKEKSVISIGNEVIIPSSGESSEDISRASVVSKPGIILGGDLNIVRPSNKIDPVFLALSLSNGKQQKELSKRAQGKSVVHLQNSDLKEVNLFFPKKEEQIKIGEFFKQLDKAITLHHSKLEKMRALKSAYLSQMFPAEGESAPKRRFPGFTQDWEQYRLGELGSVAMNKRIFKEQTSGSGEVPFYKIGTFGSKPDAFISRKLFEEYKAKFPYPEVGDILISASGSIGRTVEYTGKDEYFQDSNIVWLKHDERLNNSFLKQFYLIVKWQGLEGSTIKRLYNKNILNTKISVPSLAEQQKIGQFFNQLDNLITLHQSKLEKLQNLKKAYLHEMFV
jgi:type I restriction enzyme, S subunit